MKILIQHGLPFFLAHGGVQMLIEQTKKALELLGVEVEYLRWWDNQQKGDIIQVYGRPDVEFIRYAHEKKIRIVISDLLTGQGSRPPWTHFLHRAASLALEKLAPSSFTLALTSRVYEKADIIRVVTPWEAHLLKRMYGVPPEKIRIVPDGVEDLFIEEPARTRGKWLVCTATITQRKRVLELALAAIKAETPVWIIGKPYAPDDPYFVAFQKLALAHPEVIRYEGPISDRSQIAKIYREARGFVLLSTKESLSLSAMEAAACECPLLLSDLPWACVTFKENASYSPIASPSVTARHLRNFYEAAPSKAIAPKPLTWKQVAEELKGIYTELLSMPQSKR